MRDRKIGNAIGIVKAQIPLDEVQQVRKTLLKVMAIGERHKLILN